MSRKRTVTHRVPTSAEWRRALALSGCIVAMACGSHSGSSAEPGVEDIFPECQIYARALDQCLTHNGASRPSLAPAMDQALLARASDPMARERYRESCRTALGDLQRTCPPQQPAEEQR